MTLEKDRPPLPAPPEVHDRSLAAALLARLRDDLPRSRERLAEAFRGSSPDASPLAAEAHRLAGAAAYCGHDALRAAATALEHAADTGDRPRIRRAWRRLNRVLDRL